MTEETVEETLSRARERTLDELGSQIAQPSIHVGGGSAAAAAASLAAASAELVVSLSDRKRTPPETSRMIQTDRERLASIRDELLVAADADEAALDQLMASYRSSGGDPSTLLAAAAATAQAIARLSLEIVEIAERNIALASRFTVSDLGAAAAIAFGSAEAALLTVEINVCLLEDSGTDSITLADELRRAADQIRERVTAAATRASTETRARIAAKRIRDRR